MEQFLDPALVQWVRVHFLEEEGTDTTDWPHQLSDALVPIWEEIPSRPSIVSLGACPNIVRRPQQLVAAAETTEQHFELLMETLAK